MNKHFESGTFFTGVNYWASNAGLHMWTDWDAQTVDDDLRRLAENNIRNIRVFPLWSEFQPLCIHRGCRGEERELRFREEPLDRSTAAGRACIDLIMVSRFEIMLDLAKKHGISVIVGLITGWMSGRLFTPPAFEGRNPLNDPFVIKWELKYVDYLVRRFASHPAIIAWDLGNECNCLGDADKNEAYTWSAAVTNTIKSVDGTRPVISGMHSLLPGEIWSPEDQGEVLDVLCTHPYPLFTPYCGTDPLNEQKSILHSTAETVMYGDIGGVPAFVEEMGTLGDMIANRSIAADYVRSALWSQWAHDCKGFMWWCAYEQSHLTKTPYDWDSVERELGLFDKEKAPKPALEAISTFTKFTDDFEFEKLPPRIVDAVCVLSKGQDKWAAAFGTFLLAKKINADIRYAYADGVIPDARFYILPCLDSNSGINAHVMKKILEKVKNNGAGLYISLGDVLLSDFESFTGLKVQKRYIPTSFDKVKIGGEELALMPSAKLVLDPTSAKVLATDSNGIPVMAVNDYGRGKVYTVAYPLEYIAAKTPCVISGEHEERLYKFYEAVDMLVSDEKCASIESGELGMTEHILNEHERLLVFVNYSPREKNVKVKLNGYVSQHVCGESNSQITATVGGFKVKMPANDGVAVLIKKLDK